MSKSSVSILGRSKIAEAVHAFSTLKDANLPQPLTLVLAMELDGVWSAGIDRV